MAKFTQTGIGIYELLDSFLRLFICRMIQFSIIYYRLKICNIKTTEKVLANRFSESELTMN